MFSRTITHYLIRSQGMKMDNHSLGRSPSTITLPITPRRSSPVSVVFLVDGRVEKSARGQVESNTASRVAYRSLARKQRLPHNDGFLSPGRGLNWYGVELTSISTHTATERKERDEDGPFPICWNLQYILVQTVCKCGHILQFSTGYESPGLSHLIECKTKKVHPKVFSSIPLVDQYNIN